MEQAISPKERVELAELAGINEQYLYQCLTGRRDMEATEAVRVERATGHRLRRWQLRRNWHLTWPELIDAAGAPEVPTTDPEPSKAGG